MSATINLTSRIEGQLPAEMVGFLKAAGESAEKRQARLYLVGGVVRDLLLGRGNLDLDLVVEGDAISLAQEMAQLKKGKTITHPRFGTAKVRWKNRSADLATARAETYARPGALPSVKPGSIKDDLARRDLTINAMAVELGERFGELLDPYGGRKDLGRRLIRVLHENSFTDDATRIWRALRYEQRLDFNLEPDTEKWLQRDIARLDTISGDRIRHELELVLREELPEKALHRADELGVLKRLHPSLRGDDWLAGKFACARETVLPDTSLAWLYLVLLAYRLTEEEAEKFIAYLRLPKAAALPLRDTLAIKAKIGGLSVPGLAPSRIYDLLHSSTTLALTANAIAADSATAAEHIQLHLNALRYVKTALTGGDLIKMGVPQGPRMKEILQALREARLDGKIGSRKEEKAMVRRLLSG